jgi:hypothetical protein
MLNDRPIENPRLQAAMEEVLTIYRRYDLAGAVMLVSEDEAAYAYPLYTTWNAVVEDETVQPLGFRIRVKTAEQGEGRAKALALGTAHLFCQLKDFGAQTQLWMGDLIGLLRKAGWDFVHRPFNGRTLPRIAGHP